MFPILGHAHFMGTVSGGKKAVRRRPCLSLPYSASRQLLTLGILSKYPSAFPFLSPAIPAALPVLACAKRKRGCLYLLGRRLGFQAQADRLFCFNGYLYACFLTRILSVCRVCLESAFGDGLITHTQAAHGRHPTSSMFP